MIVQGKLEIFFVPLLGKKAKIYKRERKTKLQAPIVTSVDLGSIYSLSNKFV